MGGIHGILVRRENTLTSVKSAHFFPRGSIHEFSLWVHTHSFEFQLEFPLLSVTPLKNF